MATLTAERKTKSAVDSWAAHNASSHIPNAELRQSILDARAGRDIFGTFATAKEAMDAMLAAIDELDDEEDNLVRHTSN